jgi:hypothetical protein
MAFLRGKLWRYGLCLFFVLGLNFFIVQLMPGDPLVHLVGEETYFHLERTNPQALTDLRAKYGLTGPLCSAFFPPWSNWPGSVWAGPSITVGRWHKFFCTGSNGPWCCCVRPFLCLRSWACSWDASRRGRGQIGPIAC